MRNLIYLRHFPEGVVPMPVKPTDEWERPVSLSDWAYERIKALILQLEFKPGQQLQIEDVTEMLGISRTPIREAILRLERDGLMRIVPRVGMFVTDITSEDLEELYELRELLEGRAVERAVQYLTDDDLDSLERILDGGAKSVEAGNVDEFLRAEVEFHSFLLDHSGNRRMIVTMESFRDLTYRWRVLSLMAQESLAETLAEHRKILEALRARKAGPAGRLMKAHIRAARARIQHVVPKQGERTST